MTDRLVTLDVAGSAAVIRLNRPTRHNALVPGLLEDLLDALADERSRKARAVILAAEGPSFSTGGDLLGFWRHRHNIADYAQRLVGLLNEAMLALYTHPVPVTCAVQGQVTGGSLGFLLAADRVIMQRDICITPWYSEVGFSPDGGWTTLLPGIIGRQQALDWISNNTSATAQECLEMGVAHELVASDVFAAALAWSNQYAASDEMRDARAGPPLDRKMEDISKGLEAERVAFVRQIQTPEALAGIAGFLGKQIHEDSK